MLFILYYNVMAEEYDVTVINSSYNILWRRKSVKQDHKSKGFW